MTTEEQQTGASEFGVTPWRYLQSLGTPEARSLLERYFDSYSGSWFEGLADAGNPGHFTAADLVAVSMLGVEIPAHAAIWILGDGREDCQGLLGQIPNDVDIWQVEPSVLADGEPADELWRLLQSGCWPALQVGNGLGPVMAGKLLAAKRPRVVPIYDRLIGAALRPADGRFWSGMWHAFQDEALREQLTAIRDGVVRAGVVRASQLCLLRTLDIAVWLHEHEQRRP